MANSKKAFDWPAKSRSAVQELTVATAPPNWVEVGRITEQGGRASLKRKSHGSGRILLVWVSSSCRLRRDRVGGAFRFGGVGPLGVFGAIHPRKGWGVAFPDL